MKSILIYQYKNLFELIHLVSEFRGNNNQPIGQVLERRSTRFCRQTCHSGNKNVGRAG